MSNPYPIPQLFALRGQPPIASDSQQAYEVEMEIRRIGGSIKLPKYTCPSCRAAIMIAPAEAFGMKSIVNTIAATKGESAPANPRRGMEPWIPFFPMLSYADVR